jgi:hypothetical protein
VTGGFVRKNGCKANFSCKYIWLEPNMRKKESFEEAILQMTLDSYQ